MLVVLFSPARGWSQLSEGKIDVSCCLNCGVDGGAAGGGWITTLWYKWGERQANPGNKGNENKKTAALQLSVQLLMIRPRLERQVSFECSFHAI
jgi:hypothetical protein